MYNKIRKRDDNSLLLRMNKNYLDRDSGIVTETESDMEQPQPTKNYIFSDDDEQVNQVLNSLGDIHNIPLENNNYLALNSPSYFIALADQAVISIRHHLKDNNWKKVLKHKSGTTVHMLENNAEKTALFRGEMVIEGFTPQSIFYVIGMRKLWDEQFEEGNLVENLNDTTSLTYESYKSTATSKAHDFTLVEKIECSSDGEILFACTSVDTPKVPKSSGKNRSHINLQGWILKQLHTSPVSTKVTYITQENIKGWIPGLTKKSLARKPLIIASIDNYLRKKSDRLRLQQHTPPAINSTLSSTKSYNTLQSKPSRQSPVTSTLQDISNTNSSYSIPISQQASPTLGPLIPLPPTPDQKISNIILSNPPPRISSLAARPNSTKHISFADETFQQSRSSSPMSSSAYTSSSSVRSSYENEEQMEKNEIHSSQSPPPLISSHSSSSNQLSPIQETPPLSPFSLPVVRKDLTSQAIAGSKLYPASRHRIARKQCIDQLKSYAESDLTKWKMMGEKNNRTTLYTKIVEGSTLPVLRSETAFYGSWTPEQICSVIQCFGSRKIWDVYFEGGQVVERFSQKEYLIYTQMKSIFPIQSRDFSILTCIESNVTTGSIFLASTSVHDDLIPTTHHIRGSWKTYGWVLEPIRSSQQRLMGVKATFIAHLDMGGNTPLPSSIARLLTNEIPSCVDQIQNYLRKNGCPPYIRRVAGKITLEAFEDENKQYQIQYIAKHSPSARQYRSRNSTHMIQSMWCTDLRVNQSMYPFGCTVHTQPAFGLRVEMRDDATGFRIYTEKDDMDGQTIKVIIRQNQDCPPGSKPLFSWNGIPFLDQEEEKDIIASINTNETKATHFEKDQQVTTSMIKTVNHMKSESEQILHKTNDKSDYEKLNTPTIITLSEDLSFTGQQFSLIILLMAICYYLGKFSCRCSI